MAQNDPHPSGSQGTDPGAQTAAPQSAGAAMETTTQGSGATGREQQPAGRPDRPPRGLGRPAQHLLRRQPLRALSPAERRHGTAVLRRRSGAGELRGVRRPLHAQRGRRGARRQDRRPAPTSRASTSTTSGSTSRTTRWCSRASGGRSARTRAAESAGRSAATAASAGSFRCLRARAPRRPTPASRTACSRLTSPCSSNRGAGASTSAPVFSPQHRHELRHAAPGAGQHRPHPALKRAAPRFPAPASSAGAGAGSSRGCYARGIRGPASAVRPGREHQAGDRSTSRSLRRGPRGRDLPRRRPGAGVLPAGLRSRGSAPRRAPAASREGELRGTPEPPRRWARRAAAWPTRSSPG